MAQTRNLLARMFPTFKGQIHRPSMDKQDPILDESEDEEDEDFPSFKSVVFKPDSNLDSAKIFTSQPKTAPEYFFDESSKRMVEIDNFSFPQDSNHFMPNGDNVSSDSSLALLDSNCLAAPADPYDIMAMGNSEKPKILSPHSSKNTSFSSEDSYTNKLQNPIRRKLSEEEALPSRSNGLALKSRIPRFQKSHRSHSSSSPVQRKIDEKKPSNSKLAKTRSHSASNLSKISVIEYHNMQPKPRRDARSSSCGNIDYSHIESKVKQYINRENVRNNVGSNIVASQGQKSLSLSNLAADKPLSDLNKTKDSVQEVLMRDSKESSGQTVDYSRVESKVKRYILNAKRQQKEAKVREQSFLLSPGRKSLSMSNLVMDASSTDSSGSKAANAGKMKAFLSSRNLDDLQVCIRPKSRAESALSCQSVDKSRLSRLLDNLTDEDDDGLAAYDNSDEEDVCIYPVNETQDDVVIEVEDLLKLAIDERRGKQEAKHVLSQLQENYDNLQRRYAEAENIIDKYRFGHSSEHLAPETEDFNQRDSKLSSFGDNIESKAKKSTNDFDRTIVNPNVVVSPDHTSNNLSNLLSDKSSSDSIQAKASFQDDQQRPNEYMFGQSRNEVDFNQFLEPGPNMTSDHPATQERLEEIKEQVRFSQNTQKKGFFFRMTFYHENIDFYFVGNCNCW